MTFLAYGPIQGATEFFPISSGAHLNILSQALGLAPPGPGESLALHLGSAMAIVAHFRKELPSLIRSYGVVLLLATGVSGGLLVLGEAWGLARGQNLPMALCLGGGGILLWVGDVLGPRGREVSWKGAIVLGLAQAGALFPGVSRSGATITAGRLLGVSRSKIIPLSFLLSVPLALGGVVYKLPEVLREFSPQWALGLLISFGVGLVVLPWAIRLLTTMSFAWWAVYRLALGAWLILSGL